MKFLPPGSQAFEEILAHTGGFSMDFCWQVAPN